MATGIIQPIRPWDIEDLRSGTFSFLQPASFTSTLGTPCTVNAAGDGYIAECATTFKQAAIILMDTGTNTTAGALIQSFVIRPDVLFEVTLSEAWAVALQEKSYGLVKDATTKNWYLSTANTGNQMTIVAPLPEVAVGDTNSRVLARFNPQAIQNGFGQAVNSLQPGVGADLASGTTITPTNQVHHVTGTTAVATITTPAGLPDGYQLTIIPEGVFATTTAGNIGLITSATVVKRTLIMTWDRALAKWFPSYVS
jgi:hypothetical protein